MSRFNQASPASAANNYGISQKNVMLFVAIVLAAAIFYFGMVKPKNSASTSSSPEPAGALVAAQSEASPEPSPEQAADQAASKDEASASSSG
ncbi:hypothetical protein IJT17_06400, partial [bacterium]|nr:hypothetical protein [bacterium]